MVGSSLQRFFCLGAMATAALSGCAHYEARQQRAAVAWVETQGGRVTYDHQAKNLKPVNVWYSTGSEEDAAQWQSRLPEDTPLAKAMGRDFAYKVHEVSFYQSKLDGDPEVLKHANGMKELGFGDCDINQKMLVAIGKCQELEKLDFVDCRIKNAEALIHLAALPKLTALSIMRTTLDGPGIQHIARCTNLEQLELTGCKFDAAEAVHLRSLTKLTACDFNGTSVGDAEIGIVRHWPKLERLVLGEGITDAAMVDIKTVKSLKGIAFDGSLITDASLDDLAELPNLNQLHLGERRVSQEAMTRWHREHPDVEVTSTDPPRTSDED